MTTMITTLFKIIDFVLGLIFGLWIPIGLSAAFCFFTGLNFFAFWGIVFSKFYECGVLYLSWLTPDRIGQFIKDIL